MRMVLANGFPRLAKTMTFDVAVILNDRHINVSFIAVPEHEESRTLLGVDIISEANLVLDLARMGYYFADAIIQRYPFEKESQHEVQISSVYVKVKLREDQAVVLSKNQHDELNGVLQEYKTVFSPSNKPTKYAIKLTDDTPISVPPYRLSPLKMEVLSAEVNVLLHTGIVEECDSPYAALTVLVVKKDGKFRMGADCRILNAVTVPDRYPLPSLDDLLHATTQTFYISTLCLRLRYHKVSVKPEDRDKIAFIIPFGFYRFTRMPFGLRNAPATFQRLIDRFGVRLPDVTILAYLDDLVFSYLRSLVIIYQT